MAGELLVHARWKVWKEVLPLVVSLPPPIGDNTVLELIWVGLAEDSSQFTLDKEPDTTGWQRFNARLMSWFVPESQL